MKCISRSTILLASLLAPLAAAESCVLVDGARILAADLATIVPAFSELPPDKDLAPAPVGTLVRVFHRAQLAALLPGAAAELPNRLCVQRKRDVIPGEVWQTAVEEAMTRLCPTAPWKAKVLESPNHRFPSGVLSFSRPGLIASRGSVQMWRGALILPDKSSVPVWVRAEIQTKCRAMVLQRAVAAGSVLGLSDYREEDVWSPGLCAEGNPLRRPDGMATKRNLVAGAHLLPEDLRRPPAVHRGQSVELEVGSGAARLRVPAVAEHDADVGDQVHLKNSWNGSRVVGRVTGTQKARVE